jgi:hypothetical protein
MQWMQQTWACVEGSEVCAMHVFSRVHTRV